MTKRESQIMRCTQRMQTNKQTKTVCDDLDFVCNRIFKALYTYVDVFISSVSSLLLHFVRCRDFRFINIP